MSKVLREYILKKAGKAKPKPKTGPMRILEVKPVLSKRDKYLVGGAAAAGAGGIAGGIAALAAKKLRDRDE